MGSASDIAKQLLLLIDKNGSINSLRTSNDLKTDHQSVVGAVKSLEALGDVVAVSQQVEKVWTVTDEGASLASNGSHEARLMAQLPTEGKSITDLKANFPNANIAIGAAMKNKWVKKDGDVLKPVVTEVRDEVMLQLQAIQQGNAGQLADKVKADFKKRKLIKEMDVTSFTVKKGDAFTTEIKRQEAELTKEMIESGSWKEKSFKPYNFKSKGKSDRAGHLHPLMQLRSEFRQIFLEMGFSEMPTNNFVESAFWNFDALFQPQQHPARDAHDTFYVADPAEATYAPPDYQQRVAKTHSTGGYGSQGYNYDWSEAESRKNLLRTHTTAVSARMLYQLAQNGFKPAKYFSIDRVFRNETLDATHLAEFHQVEGVVADYNLSIRDLMGVIKAFFEKIGITKLRFKSTYNPYTEPSMEVFSYHEGLKKWVELGNSGIFRPEMLRPMGVPEGVTVIAWGLSLERPAMIMIGSNNIRELVGPKVRMELIMDNPVCILDKFRASRKKKSSAGCKSSPPTLSSVTNRQEKILQRLQHLQHRLSQVATKLGVEGGSQEGLKAQLTTLRLTGGPEPGKSIRLAVHADPRRPPLSLKPFLHLLSFAYTTQALTHTHSSAGDVSEKLHKFLNQEPSGDKDVEVYLHLMWHRQEDMQPGLRISPTLGPEIVGEANVARYLARLVELDPSAPPIYERLSLAERATVDCVIDEQLQMLNGGTSKEKKEAFQQLMTTLTRRPFLAGDRVTLADLLALSVLQQQRMLNSAGSSQNTLARWLKDCLSHQLCKESLI